MRAPRRAALPSLKTSRRVSPVAAQKAILAREFDRLWKLARSHEDAVVNGRPYAASGDLREVRLGTWANTAHTEEFHRS